MKWSFYEIIYFRHGLSQRRCVNQLTLTFDHEACSKTIVCNCYNKFKGGRYSLTDKFKAGRPKFVPDNIEAERKLIMQDRHVTYDFT